MRGLPSNITNWKAAAGFVAAGLLLCSVTGSVLAAPPPKGGGGHPPPPHPAAAPHIAAPRMAAPHVAMPHPVPHFAPRAAAPHFAPHITARPHFTPHVRAAHNRPNISHRNAGVAHRNLSTAHSALAHGHRGRNAANAPLNSNATSRFERDHNRHAHNLPGTSNGRNRALSNANGRNRALANARVRPLANAADPRHFRDRRRFADNAAMRPFWHRDWRHHGWHPYDHLGWIGPVFWPYAYGDFFYYSLWPYDYQYADPFWVYGYGDIYEAIFSPYDYSEYVQGSGAPQRMATLTESMAQSCNDEAAEVTGWPIDQIQDAVQPNSQQTALLDDLGNAIVEASHQIKINCPTSVAFTPTDRLEQMHAQLQTLVKAVDIISPPLTNFYDSLSDEQKARFNDIAPQGTQNPQGAQTNAKPENTENQPNQPNLQAQCGANVMAWPTDRIDSAIHPNDAQRAKLDDLKSALSQGSDIIKAACPSEPPATPPERLAAVGKRLQAMLHAVETVQPALAAFYNALSDDQKARFNTMGRQLFAQNQD